MLANISEETAASIFRIKEQQMITVMTVTQTVGTVKLCSHELGHWGQDMCSSKPYQWYENV
jgi:hypothetical protein